jgi:hypothetical protein
MKKKLLLTVAIVAALTGAFFQAKAKSYASWQCRGIGPYICDFIIDPLTGDDIPIRGQFKLPDL